MRYDNMFWVLLAPSLASCACFAFEMFCSPTGSWNDCFEKLRRGFEMLGGKGKLRNTQVSLPEVLATGRTEACGNCGAEARVLDETRDRSGRSCFERELALGE